MFWIAAVVLFFIIVLGRRWVAEAIGMPWNNIGAFVLGYLALLAGGIFFCSHKAALGFGIAGAIIGAYFGGMVLGEGE